jgi:PAS domain S-box-containing protein
MARLCSTPCAAYLLILVLAGALGAAALLRVHQRTVHDEVVRQQDYHQAVAELTATGLRELHSERLSDLHFFTKDPAQRLDQALAASGDEFGAARVRRMLEELIARGHYHSGGLVDRSGRVLVQVPRDADLSVGGGTASSPRMSCAREAADGVVLEYDAPAGGGTRLHLHARVPGWLSPLSSGRLTSPSSELLIFERRGGELVPVRRLGHAREEVRSTSLDGPTLSARAARGESGAMRGPDHRGVMSLGAAHAVPEMGWVVVSKVDEDEVLAPIKERLRLLFAIGLALLALAGVVGWAVLRAQREAGVAEADAERKLLAAAIEQADESVVITDASARILYTNPAFTRASGYSREEVQGRNPSALKSGKQGDAFYAELWRTLRSGATWSGRFINRRKDGKLFEEQATIAPVRDASGAVTHYIAVKRDVSSVRSLEQQLQQAQKMEAVGRLAGGIAHDFNNILTTISGFAEMLGMALPPESPEAADLAEIVGASRRAALLTRQLLLFSRRAQTDPAVIDLRVPMKAIEKMLRRSLGEDVRLSLDLPPEPAWVHADAGQLDQVVMNLAVNARDAMPHGGAFRLSVRETELDAPRVTVHSHVPAGRYALLTAEDDGSGIPPDVLPRIFEPFFTTKPAGKGTGLGLATVFGIVQSAGGHIDVDSAPGSGTRFSIYLPLVPAPSQEPAACPDPGSVPRGDEDVLVVEDQSEVLRLLTRELTRLGYRVRGCATGAEALAALTGGPTPPDLLITDVVMPGMGGAELALRARALHPALRLLFVSGYTDGRLDELPRGQNPLLLKPFSIAELARRVREALDAGAPPLLAAGGAAPGERPS